MTETREAASPSGQKKTPLYDAHRKLGAKIIDFGGWLMPVSYPTGIIDEHKACRGAVGVFDVSHMGEIHFRGPRAAAAVQRLVTGDVSKLAAGHALYSVACRPTGGIVDDLIVYRVAADHFLIVVNASNIEKDWAWFQENVGSWCDLRNASDETALISYQGPKAQSTLQALSRADLDALKPFDFVTDVDVAGVRAWIARTGYTGEDGFELFCPSGDAQKLWAAVLEAASPAGGRPVGLGARDTLRLEARLSLYGNDLSDETTPLEAGLGWVVKLEAGDFIGREALRAQKAAGVTRKLVGFVMLGRGIARHGYPIHEGTAASPGARVGEVTSGAPGPTVGQNIGMGYVPSRLGEPGGRLVVDCRGKMIEADIVRGPFYRKGT